MGQGEDFTVSGAWGFNTDRAVFGIGVEYQYRDEVRLRDRDFLDGCDTNYEIDQNGNIYTVGKRDNAIVRNRSNGTIGVSESSCKVTGLSGRIFNEFTRFGSIYFAPGQGNVPGLPNFAENTNAFGQELDRNGDGIRDVDFQNYNTNAANLDQTFISQQKLLNAFAYGEYTFPGEANITPFFEAQFTRAKISAPNEGLPQLFPFVPDINPFNPCNIVTGTDCVAADNALQELNRGQANFGRAGRLATGFSTPVQPIVSIVGDRNNFQVTQEQYRGVLGVRGDLPFIGSSWTFEVAGVYSRSKGVSTRNGIREDRLALALGLDPTADYNGDGVFDNNGDGIADDYDPNLSFFDTFDPQVIGVCNGARLANPGAAAPDLLQGCVPVNLFAPSVLGSPLGNLASAEERNYLFDQRRFDTTYEQKMLSAYVTGDLFELPAGPVGVVLGGEWREDSIDSEPNFQAANGLFFGFFADEGAAGSKWIRELFGEVNVPLMAGETLVEELEVNISGRLTDEEFYGTNGTFALKGGWRPVAPLLLKFSYGTSFRAPNLRENFLRAQTGFLTLFDPCAVPGGAFDAAAGGYQPQLETRDPVILANCRREGRDPTRVGINDLGLNTDAFASTEIASGGSFDLEPETSRSITTGFAFEEDWASGFEFSLNFNYYDIKVKQSIIEPSPQFIINDCFTRADGTRSPFCDRIDVSGTGRRLVSDVFAGFLNLDQESVRGIDINTTFGYPLTVGGETFDLALNIVANKLIERSTTFVNDNGSIDTEDFAGEFGFPEWTGRATFNVGWKDFTFTWQTRYIDAVAADAEGRDPFSDAFGFGPDGQPTPGFFSDTCLGSGSRFTAGPRRGQLNGVVPGDGLFCRNVDFADEWFEHTASIRWDNGDFRIIAGVTNIFNNAPPLVDSAEVFAIANTPIGNGYNLDGREFFAQLLYRF